MTGLARVAYATAMASVAGGALAEGAHLRLDCKVATSCNEAGVCATGDEATRFDIAPEETDDDGAGRYQIIAGDAAAVPAAGLTRTGPFVWSPASGVRKTLTLTSETTALLVRQVTNSGTGAPPSAEINMMNCEVAY